MADETSSFGARLREHGVAVGVAVAFLVLFGAGVRWIVKGREAPPPKKVLTITGVVIRPDPPSRPPPPPPPTTPSKVEEEPPQSRLVEVKPTDIPPEAPRESAPAAGPLALATEATGAGDAFNLVGNPGGRSLLGPGAIGEGTGNGLGGGSGDASSRFAWYFGRIASQVEDAFRRLKETRTAQARVELKLWADDAGRITQVELLRSTGNEELDQAIRSVVGLRLREPLPPDIPMPVVFRFTARRPGAGRVAAP